MLNMKRDISQQIAHLASGQCCALPVLSSAIALVHLKNPLSDIQARMECSIAVYAKLRYHGHLNLILSFTLHHAFSCTTQAKLKSTPPKKKRKRKKISNSCNVNTSVSEDEHFQLLIGH